MCMYIVIHNLHIHIANIIDNLCYQYVVRVVYNRLVTKFIASQFYLNIIDHQFIYPLIQYHGYHARPSVIYIMIYC